MPAATLLSALSAAGVLERPSSRRGAFLRVTPRFLDHAERTAARLRLTGRPAQPASVLDAALATWDDYRHDPHQGALLLVDFLDGRSQLGGLQPVFPALEAFSAAA
jgi:hypothetical protein